MMKNAMDMGAVVRGAVLACTVMVLVVLCPVTAVGQDEAGRQAGAVSGMALDAETGEPVGWAQILIEEAARSTTSRSDGRFVLLHVQPGTYTLKAYRIGYETLNRRVEVQPGDTLQVTLRLTGSLITADEVIVEGERAEARVGEADVAMENRTLRQNLSTTIAETLEQEPGIAMQSMGPAPARPVLRGLGGERLLVLEDGGPTGDLSHTSSDHAVVVDPMTAERIEVVRGPASLVYGPNALGGVVNVERGYVPTERTDRLRANVSTQVESVSRGIAGGGAVAIPAGPFMVRADGSLRQADDVHTPEGVLENTAIETYNASVGASLVRPWGFVGASGSYYQSDYGIPGGFTGAHPNGVSIALQRRHYEARGAYRLPGRSVPRIEARGTYSWYFHQEFESNGNLGVEYGVLSYHGRVLAHTRGLGPFTSGMVGVSGAYRDYASGGFVNTPASVEATTAAFAFQQVDLDRLTLKASLRADARSVRPSEERETRIGWIRQRTFGGVSASASGVWHTADDRIHAGLRVMRSLRMPGIEELYSEGPHLAAYTMEVGQPDLDAERGWGSELFGRFEGSRLEGSAAVYYNYITGYIFPRNTGHLDVRRRLPVYQYTGARAALWGGEASASYRLSSRLAAGGGLSYVRGSLLDSGRPLPEIPPLSGTLSAEYAIGALEVGATLRLAADQERVYTFDEGTTGPQGGIAVAEQPTNGYGVLDLSLQYHLAAGALLHTFTLGIDNALDTTYRDHLSRVRVIMPEPGRNVRVLYRVYF